jgi:subtilase family serine protease
MTFDLAIDPTLVGMPDGPDTDTLPDLLPMNLKLNQLLSVQFNVKNLGSDARSGNWYDAVYLSDDSIFDGGLDGRYDLYLDEIYRSFSNESSLESNGNYFNTAFLSIPGFAGTGSKYLLFITDDDQTQLEIDESNNVVAVPITIAAPDVDLQIHELTAPSSGLAGELFPVTWTIKNTGSESTGITFGFHNDLYLSTDTTLDIQDLPIWGWGLSLLRSEEFFTIPTANLTIPGYISSGTYYLIAVSDTYGSQGETNEANNFLVSAPIEIIARDIDLVVTSANSPATASATGDNVQVSWTVTNQGTVASNADWYDSIYISDDAVFDASDRYVTDRWAGNNTPLAAGASYSATQTIALPSTTAGSRYLLFVGDDYNNQGETDETNNVRAVPMEFLAAGADLAISATAPSTAILGSTVNLTWTVENQGNRSANSDWSDYVYLSNDQILDSSDVRVISETISAQTPLKSGGAYTINKNFTLAGSLPTGDRYFLFVADGSRNQGETNEANNVRAVPVQITAPNLVVSTVSAPKTGILGEMLRVSWTVNNEGNANAVAQWYDRIYISDDQVLDTSDTILGLEVL